MVFLQSVYNILGVAHTANEGDLWGLVGILLIVAGAFLNFLTKDREVISGVEGPEVAPVSPAKVVKKEEKAGWSERLRKGLLRSREEVWDKLEKLFSKNVLDEETLEAIEELLYTADLGPRLASELIVEFRLQVQQLSKGEATATDYKDYLYKFLYQRMGPVQKDLPQELFQFEVGKSRPRPIVIMIVGVNGVGKTTTIGKLATRLTRQGAKVVVGACDTFRAAAVDQLQVWCDRAGASMVRAKEGAGPSGVGYEALEKAINLKADYCILDTAGRLHTKENLMDELKKSKNVLSKLDPSAPHHVLLVLDAITGQNALKQAEEFHKALGLTGLIYTKCDGSSKAGAAVGIVNQLQIPITYIGVGESVDDLNKFDLNEYLWAMLDNNASDHSSSLH